MSDSEEKKCTTLDKIFDKMKLIDVLDLIFLVVVVIGCLNWAPVVFGYDDLVKRWTKSAPGFGTFIYGAVVFCALAKIVTWVLVRTNDRDKKVVNEPTE